MRFAAITAKHEQPQQPARLPAAQLIRRFVTGQPALGEPPAAPRPQEVPPDLDQRVRLIGEW